MSRRLPLRKASHLVLTLTASLLAPFSTTGCEHSSATPPLQRRAGAAETGAPANAVSVQTVIPQRRDLSVKFEQPGSVMAYEEADLFAKVTGYVNDVFVDIGDEVKADQTLLTLDVPDLEEDLAYKQSIVRQASAEHEQAEAARLAAEAALGAWDSQWAQAVADVKKADANLKFRRQQAKRYADLAQNDAAPPALADEKREEFEAAESALDSAKAKRLAVESDKATLEAKLAAAKADVKAKAARIEVAQADVARTRVNVEFSRLKAPFAGVITSREVDPGTFVNSATSGRGEPLFTLCRMDKLIVVQRVPERIAGLVRVGCKATMAITTPEPREIGGTVARYSRSLDKQKTMRVEIDLENKDGSVYPGMYGPVTLILREIPKALTIPAEAVYAVSGQSYVVQVRNRQARRVLVTTGYDDGVVVQVLSGLSGNEEIVVSNKGQLSEGQVVDPHRVDDRSAADSTGSRR